MHNLTPSKKKKKKKKGKFHSFIYCCLQHINLSWFLWRVRRGEGDDITSTADYIKASHRHTQDSSVLAGDRTARMAAADREAVADTAGCHGDTGIPGRGCQVELSSSPL